MWYEHKFVRMTLVKINKQCNEKSAAPKNQKKFLSPSLLFLQVMSVLSLLFTSGMKNLSQILQESLYKFFWTSQQQCELEIIYLL